MQLPTKYTDYLSELANKLRHLSETLSLGLAAATETAAAGTDLLAARPTASLLRLLDGQVNYYLDGKLLWQCEPGDLLGLTRSLDLPGGEWRAAEPVTLAVYDRDAWLTHVHATGERQRAWSHYLLCQQSFLELTLAQHQRAPFQPAAGFLHVRAGETIIQQGDMADQVYTLLEGSAEAYCDGVKVGEVNTNEIFGALAVFTRQPRMASIVATSDSTLLAVRKAEFIDLIEQQPQICLSLIEEMAVKINQLNGQLRDLKK